eukprot:TRINITY_DN49865_c0_g1_i1.p1 TRINITY_DN49865_c0_g1~~TRINITY_DN49865_c0_g1_i1.p1  ORF type:complete len:482 (-),score=87.45 TRINITY_DN49865_c0_g1_i1:32-1477(-)
MWAARGVVRCSLARVVGEPGAAPRRRWPCGVCHVVGATRENAGIVTRAQAASISGPTAAQYHDVRGGVRTLSTSSARRARRKMECAAAQASGPPPPASASTADGAPPAAETPQPLASEPPPPSAASTASTTAAETTPPAAGTAQPPPSADGPPPPAAAPSAAASEGFGCGGFFFAVDPNIGLWNDRINPTWRLTFTDRSTNEAQRVPYAFVIQNKGPNVDFAVRFQSGFVLCDGSFTAIPQTFTVENGWEVAVPLPLLGVRFCHTVIKAGETQATVSCVDLSLGVAAGVQKAVSGTGTRVTGTQEPVWRGQVAMVALAVMTLAGGYTLTTMPSAWKELYEEVMSDEPDAIEFLFDALDVDGDGYISHDDVRTFTANAGRLNMPEAADLQALAAELSGMIESSGSNRISFEQFEDIMMALMEAEERMESMGEHFASARPTQPVQIQPFGGAFAPGANRFPGLPSAPPFVPAPPGRGPQPPSW